MKLFLKYSQTACIGRFYHAFSRYFLAFCVVDEIYILLYDDRVILGLIVNCVINMLLVCYD